MWSQPPWLQNGRVFIYSCACGPVNMVQHDYLEYLHCFTVHIYLYLLHNVLLNCVKTNNNVSVPVPRASPSFL